ncbi:MAG: hypothetical protein HN742_27305 [Lentisphaerae bacterium]|jgi:hypothetical protein|nr:hypothetical protein [Lentisphaerota bacterium]MBT4823534.1 hypothetical protein [Lentisphaerota bacterium]MBT5612712.1 hypothetical protein [Lentisphaerota bacterium]MBT7060327.1 hypothetical protein [Lentisphaerota bacterium]MBT7845611.1 hypothetical protein [Lentisphaerota bacterium]
MTRQFGVHQVPALESVRPLGELAERQKRVGQRLLREDVYRPELITSDITFDYDPAPWNDWYGGHEWTWYADVSGRYLNAMVSLMPSLGEFPEIARQVLETVLANQAPDGHFGPPLAPNACDRSQASGTAWMLLALPRVAQLLGDERALHAAQRLAEWYKTVTPYWLSDDVLGKQRSKNSYALIFSNFTHCLDGLAALQRIDPDDRWADLAREIAEAAKTLDDECHSHHFLSTLRGMLDWYTLTGESAFLEKARGQCERIAVEGVLDTGGVPEDFSNPRTDEGCSEADWVLVNLKLHAITGERAFLGRAERAIYGHFFMNQCPNGGFGTWHGFHDALGAHGPGAVGRYKEAYWCCSMHGAYALTEVARHVVTESEGRLNVNLLLGCRSSFDVAGGTVVISHDASEYPYPGRARIVAELSSGESVPLTVALPSHTPLVRATLDGADQAGRNSGELSVSLSGRGRHELVLDFAPSVRAESPQCSDVFPGRSSLWYGPLPLGSNAQLSRCVYDVTEALADGLEPIPCRRPGAWASEMEFHLPATDAPDFDHTRERSYLTLYPLAAATFRQFSYLSYLF